MLRLLSALFLSTVLTHAAIAQPVERAGSSGGSAKAIGVAPVLASEHVGERRYALIVGINDYADSRIPDAGDSYAQLYLATLYIDRTKEDTSYPKWEAWYRLKPDLTGKNTPRRRTTARWLAHCRTRFACSVPRLKRATPGHEQPR